MGEVLRCLAYLLTRAHIDTRPTNYVARQRIKHFANTMYMEMPCAKSVRDMYSLTVLTPYYGEDVIYSEQALNKPNEARCCRVLYPTALTEIKNNKRILRLLNKTKSRCSGWSLHVLLLGKNVPG